MFGTDVAICLTDQGTNREDDSANAPRVLEECVYERRPHDMTIMTTITRYTGAVTTEGSGGPINAPQGEATHNDGALKRDKRQVFRQTRSVSRAGMQESERFVEQLMGVMPPPTTEE